MMEEMRSINPELEEVEKNISSLQAGYVVERQRCKLPSKGRGEACSVQFWGSKFEAYCDTKQGTPGPSKQGTPGPSGKAHWDDTKAFLASFEEVAEACQWPKREWVSRLRPALSGDAKRAYCNLDVRSRENYEEVKAAILRNDALKMETWRQHFRCFSCQEIEDPHWLHCQLQQLCHQWLKPERRSKEQILELLILEQFLASLPAYIQDWVRSKGPDSCSQAVTLVEDFLVRQQKMGKRSQQKPFKEESTDSFDAEQEIQEEDKGTKHGRDSSSSLLIERTGMDEPELVERQSNLKEASVGTSLVVEPMPSQPISWTAFWEESNRNVIGLGDKAGNEAKANIQLEQNQLEAAFEKGPQISHGIMIVKCEIEEEICMVGKQPVSERHEFSRLTEGLSPAVHSSATADAGDKMPLFSKYGRRYHYMPEFDTILSQETHQESLESDEMFHPNSQWGDWQSTVMGERRPKLLKYGNHDLSRHQVKEELNIVEIDEKGFGDFRLLGNNPSAQNEDRPYWCLQCGKNFSQKDYLSKHEKIHTGAKPFECLHCGKRFIYKRDMNRHQLTHTRVKPFQCSECGNRFGRKDSLAFHLKSHKQQQPLNLEELRLQT